ncbi:helix-turn-helix transcriptional regulator [Timonella senegalensis]|uniref:helix-turn-helix transcriptional regulator n=1 Tax=Timonella senegalensis TaxID=1465825 RepID=UPI0028A9A662|nr:helix-turn-helix transcriptional regulator [Timonella senegalensis]
MRINTAADMARLIKTQRLQLKLTQEALASAVGITRQSLGKIENGEGRASLDTYFRILNELDIRLSAEGDPGQTGAERPSPNATNYLNPALVTALKRFQTPQINTAMQKTMDGAVKSLRSGIELPSTDLARQILDSHMAASTANNAALLEQKAQQPATTSDNPESGLDND